MVKEDGVASPDDLHFEGQLKIVEYPDPISRANNKRIITFDDSLKKLVDEMLDVMYRIDGIGLSAPQVGINVQLTVFNPVGERGEGDEIVLVNPHVNRYSRNLVPYNEGCLSFPEIYADVEAMEKRHEEKTGFPNRFTQEEEGSCWVRKVVMLINWFSTKLSWAFLPI